MFIRPDHRIRHSLTLGSSCAVIRNVKAESPELIDNIMESMKSRGFINYYGMQRFGTASVSTHSVGLALLKGQWKEACEMLLSRRPGEHPDCEEARKAWWERGDPAEALKLMPRRNTAERAIWEFWARPNQEAGNHFGGLLNVSLWCPLAVFGPLVAEDHSFCRSLETSVSSMSMHTRVMYGI